MSMTGEAEILAVLGKLVAQWNYAEHCSRQIIRKRISGGDVDDRDHLRLSNRNPGWMEEELRDAVLPSWAGMPGEPYLEALVAAFGAARNYRNHYVHGVYSTHPESGDRPAQALIIPSKPHRGRTQAPQFVTAADIWPIATHVGKLGAFACDVNNAFDVRGALAVNLDGAQTTQMLPDLIAPLPPFPHEPLWRG